MCRIAGFWNIQGKGGYDLSSTIIAMRDTLSHGGPDDAGVFLNPEDQMAFGHRRLSIIDLSTNGHQPYTFENLTICYNGEVYNYVEVRESLLKLGYSFQSNSDTEVILKAFHCWGMACVERFRGMWAFAIWDQNLNKLSICRDRVGVKPLFWYWHSGVFLFASELKAFFKHPNFSAELNPNAVNEFLQHGYILAPQSIFTNTRKLLPGHWLEINNSGEIKETKYWSLPEIARAGKSNWAYWENKPVAEVRDELEKELMEAFQLRMVADVPVGMFLSGGIDSSLVTAILQKNSPAPLKTFTIGFNEKEFNEAHWAKKVADHLGTDHTELYCSPEDAKVILPDLPHIYDEPFGDSSAIPTLLVSRLARNQVTVSLSADGGDEQFYGYSVYPVAENKWNKYQGKYGFRMAGKLMQKIPPELIQQIFRTYNNPLDTASDKFTRLASVISCKDRINFYDTMMKMIVPEEVNRMVLPPFQRPVNIRYERLLSAVPEGLSMRQMMMQSDIRAYMPDDILVKVDRATMSVALEGREPFLDHHLMEFAARLPDSLKYKEGKSKYILRQVLYKYLPQALVDRPKQGFAIPVNQWFRKELKQYYDQYLDPVALKKEGIFNSDTLQHMKNAYFKQDGMHAPKLWLVLMFRMWKEKYIRE
ncbi:MAG: asparagine synthase (glutamine-hydrolyzing) [Sphingobacteriia bacterium]|nr:asparagine synthase (glutamine-hydrolyzing) [Sphingobacteriia bacterium]